MSGAQFTPEAMPSLQGRVFFITGGTAGLGAGTIKLLAVKEPARIFFSGRNESKANELVAQVKKLNPTVQLIFLACDLADLTSVQKCAREFLAQSDRLDVLYLNAGTMGNPASTTKDGYEVQFGTNHLGHALLVKLLMPALLKTTEQPGADTRIINMSSYAYRYAPKQGIAFDTLKTDQNSLGGLIPGPRWTRYGQSKLANLLYARELAKRFPSIMTVAIHPGFIKTELFDNVSFFMQVPARLSNNFGQGWTPVEKGPYNQTWAGTTARTNLESGAYYKPIGVKGRLDTAQARDDKLAAQLWDWTEKELAAYS